MEVENAYAAGPTGTTVWVRTEGPDGEEIVLRRADGKELGVADRKALERAELLMQVMAAGGQPYFSSGAYAVGLRLLERLVEPLENRQRQVAESQIRRVPFDVRSKVETRVLWQDVPAGKWQIESGEKGWTISRNAASGYREHTEYFRGTDAYARPILYGPHKVYKTVAGAQRMADKLNAEQE